MFGKLPEQNQKKVTTVDGLGGRLQASLSTLGLHPLLRVINSSQQLIVEDHSIRLQITHRGDKFEVLTRWENGVELTSNVPLPPQASAVISSTARTGKRPDNVEREVKSLSLIHI